MTSWFLESCCKNKLVVGSFVRLNCWEGDSLVITDSHTTPSYLVQRLPVHRCCRRRGRQVCGMSENVFQATGDHRREGQVAILLVVARVHDTLHRHRVWRERGDNQVAERNLQEHVVSIGGQLGIELMLEDPSRVHHTQLEHFRAVVVCADRDLVDVQADNVAK